MLAQNKACLACEQTSATCVFLSSNDSCENCKARSVDCFSLARKRPRTGILRSSPSYTKSPPNTLNRPTIRPVSNNETTRQSRQQSISVLEPSSTIGLPDPDSTSSKNKVSTPNNGTFIGRAHYLDHDVPFDETQARDSTVSEQWQPSGPADTVLKLFSAFELPHRAVFCSLLESFLTYCQPWTPVLTRGEVDYNRQHIPSYILCQSMFLAASRVSTAPSIPLFATTDQFYQRAKALFFMNHELDALTVIKATIMLQWYTPVGPEQVSYDAGEFWLRVGVGIALQIGLNREPAPGTTAAARRRIWWTLRTRDALMTVAHGRPRAINLDDTDVSPVRPEDLADAAGRGDGQLFAAYTSICCILGDISETCSRNSMTLAKHQHYENLLLEWSSQVPEHLRFDHFGANTERYISLQSQLNLRQLHLPYLLSLAIIGRSLKNETISAQSVIAASFVAGIFKDFLARDEIKYLAPIFSRYSIASGFFLALLLPLTEVWTACQSDMDVFRKSLQELGQRWKSATAGLKALEHFISLREKQTRRELPKAVWLTDEQEKLFDCFPREYCVVWPSLCEHCRIDFTTPGPVERNAMANTQIPSCDASAVDNLASEHLAFNEVDFEQFMWTNTDQWFSNS